MYLLLVFSVVWLLGPIHCFVLTLRDGIIEGEKLADAVSDKAYLQFLGIPFAEPPIGDLRFRVPAPKEPWKDTVGLEKQPACLGQDDGKESEDCLYLDIWLPGEIIPANKFIPVMLLFAAKELADNGASLATEEGIIVVVAQYRRGAFGYAYVKDSDAVPGNQGFLDQIMAMQWVQTNIDKFGGDKDRVTLIGYGSAASSVSLHLTNRRSGLLFTSVIIAGGSSLKDNVLGNEEELQRATKQLASEFGCTEDVESCLRNQPAEKLVEKAEILGDAWRPILDGHSVSGDPESLLRQRRFNVKHVLIGATNSIAGPEFNAMVPDLTGEPEKALPSDFEFVQSAKKLSPAMYADDNLPQMIIQHEYARWSFGTPTKRLTALWNLYVDYAYVCPSVEEAIYCAKGGCDTYLYSLDSHSTGYSDAQLLLGAPLADAGATEAQKAMSKAYMGYLANFARTGNPNYGPLGSRPSVEWPEYTLPPKRHLEFGRDMKAAANLRERFCHFWKYYLPNVLSLADGTFNEPKYTEKKMFEESGSPHEKYEGDGKPSACPFH